MTQVVKHKWLALGPPVPGAVHGHSRHRDRERGLAVDPDRPRVLAGEPAMGDLGLRARLRRLPAARRPPRRPAREAPDVHGRPRHLHDRLPALRPLVERGIADRGAARSRVSAPPSISPAALSILTTTFQGGSRAQHRTRRLGCGRRASALRPASCMGGVLVDLLSWQWIFFVNVPVGIFGLIATPILLVESRDERESSFDVLGAVLVTSGLSILVLAITKGQTWGWSSGRTIGVFRGLGRPDRPVRPPGIADEAPADAVLDLPAADPRPQRTSSCSSWARRSSRCS